MIFCLRVINPVIALIVFVLCFWAASTGNDKFNMLGIVAGGISTYFFAKGIFTSLSLLILGRILLEILYSGKAKNPALKGTEIIYSVAFGIFTIGSLIGLLFAGNSDVFTRDGMSIVNPADLRITDIYRVKESDKLKFSGQISNLRESEWKDVQIIGSLFIKGKLSDKKFCDIPKLGRIETGDFLIDFDGFKNMSVQDSVRLDCEITGKRI